jgi:hypothetical protein
MKNHLIVLRFAFVAIVLASMLGCNIPFIQISIGNTPTPSTANPIVTTVGPLATEQPTNSQMADMPPTQTNLKTYDSGVINFSYDMSIFMDVDAQTIPAVQLDPNGMPFGVAPLHTEIVLKGYTISNYLLDPKIYIFPSAEYGSMLDFVQQDINTLKLIIANQSAEGMGELPLLPPQYAQQLFHSNFKHIQFQNGQGIRYITQYAQAYVPINNHDVFYTFQGITSDGKTYISLILPVNNPVLQADEGPIPGSDFTAFSNNFETYLTGIKTQLNASPDDSFTPNLQLLDEMVQSLTLK